MLSSTVCLNNWFGRLIWDHPQQSCSTHTVHLPTFKLIFKDPVVNEFYDELLKHWAVRSDAVGIYNGVVTLESDSEEEGADLSMIFESKTEDPYLTETPEIRDNLDVEMVSPEQIKTGQGEENSMGTKEEIEEEGREELERFDPDPSEHPVEEHSLAIDDPYGDLANEPIGGSGVLEDENVQPNIEKLGEPGETKTMEISGSEIQQRIWRLRFLV